MTRRLFSATAGLVMVVILGGGCRPPEATVGIRRLGTMTPMAFGQDERSRRLAAAVELADAAALAAAIEAGSDVNAYGAGGYALLTWAMARGNAKGFELLLAHGASLDADARHMADVSPTSLRLPVLAVVLSNTDTRFLEAALRQGLDPNRVLGNSGTGSLLLLAIRLHADPAIEVLLDAGADIDRQDPSGYTPLVRSMMSCNYKTAWLLLRRGADPTIKDKQGYDVVWELKKYGSRGVRPDQRESFEAIVTELVARGLLTREDMVRADTPQPSAAGGPSGIRVIEHAPDSEAGRAIRDLDDHERDSMRRQRRRPATP